MKTIPAALLLTFAALRAHAGSVWLEAESATDHSTRPHSWYSNVKKDELSGGDFISHWGDRPAVANYQVKIPEAGTYVLWLRANPVSTKLSVRLGGGAWEAVDTKASHHENINIASDDKPDLRFVAWVRAGTKKLGAGEQSIGVKFHSSNHNHGMLDCLCLTTDTSWKPSRTLKPGEAKPHYAAPEIDDANLDRWIDFIRPSDEELGWRKVRWHDSLSEAAAEAEALGRPILLWAMNGHPCGET